MVVRKHQVFEAVPPSIQCLVYASLTIFLPRKISCLLLRGLSSTPAVVIHVLSVSNISTMYIFENVSLAALRSALSPALIPLGIIYFRDRDVSKGK